MKSYSAKWVLPMDGRLIEDGEVVVEGSTIVDVRPIRTPANERKDLGNAVLLPGLVNAHTHLEYTSLRGFLEDVPFFTWIRTLNASKANLSAEDWVTSAKIGALECLASGITTIGDNTDSGAALDAAVWSGLRGTVYQEFFCIDHRTSVSDTLNELAAKIVALKGRQGSRLTVGISPHATYTINPAMFRGMREDSRINSLGISIHVAESPAEVSLTAEGRGPFAEMFERRGILWETPSLSPTAYVAEQGVLGSRTLLIHCVHQSEEDIALCARSNSAIIHCPKSNAKLGAGIAPLTKWLAQEDLRLGIGTDSAVSNNSLDLFEEMRFALLLQRAKNEQVTGVTARDILALATTRGAEAMGLGDTVGALTVGRKADLIALSLDGLHMAPASAPEQAIVYSARASDIRLTVIDGEVCYDDGRFVNLDTYGILLEASALRNKLSKAGS